MLKIFYAPYILKPLLSLNAVTPKAQRRGALIKVQWMDKKIGYSDCHPWPEFGDLPIEEQLASIRSGQMSPRIEQAIWLARRDAVARSAGHNLFEGLLRVKNNLTVTEAGSFDLKELDNIKSRGFTKLKIKVGRDFDKEMDLIKKAVVRGFFVRLDFNGTGNWQVFEKFMAVLGPNTRPRVDYIEDPFPYDEDEWREARKFTKLALDNEHTKVNWENLKDPPFDVLVIKPAIMDVDLAIKRMAKHKLMATFTSSMDHVVGCVHALLLSAEYKLKYMDNLLEPGCMTFPLYEPDDFTNDLEVQGPYIVKTKGTGIGFNEIFEKQKWFPVSVV